ncbi:MAG: outer membrane beta-barrel protein [Hyphomonas sp.]
MTGQFFSKRGYTLNKDIRLLAAAFSAMAAAPLAHAGDFQISGGGEYIFDSNDTELNFTAVTGRAAYFFNENLGIEGEGTFGTSGAKNYDNSGLNFELKSQFGGYAVGRLPVGEHGEMFGRLGFRAGTIDVTGDFFGPVSESVDYNGISAGLGYSHFFNDSVGVRAEFTTSGASLDNNFSPDGNLTGVSVSLVMKLGGKS